MAALSTMCHSTGVSKYCGGIREIVTLVYQPLLTFHCSCSWGHTYPTHLPCQDMAGVMLGASGESCVTHHQPQTHISHTLPGQPLPPRSPFRHTRTGAASPTLPVVPQPAP